MLGCVTSGGAAHPMDRSRSQPGLVPRENRMECMYPKCPNTSRTRGLCHGHYQLMRDRVRRMRVTEEDLEARGLITPKGQGGTPASDSLGAFEKGSEVVGKIGRIR